VKCEGSREGYYNRIFEFMRPHQNLDCRKLGIDLSVELYNLTKSFPSEEKFGLISQIRRAGSSIPVNIAEGAARQTTKEFIHFLYISEGSLSEVETLLLISLKLGYLSEDAINELNMKFNTLSKIIIGLRKKLQKDN
jgi:four helix bundle protein